MFAALKARGRAPFGHCMQSTTAGARGENTDEDSIFGGVRSLVTPVNMY